jgi:GT2 family glycosyltransferase
MKFTKKLIPISSKDITIVILLYNTPHNLVKNLLVYKDFNILILDQSNDLILKTKLLKLLPNIKYYKVTNKNLGFATGINYLVNKVKTKYFLCTQVDVLLTKKDIFNLTKTFKIKNNCIISIPSIQKNKFKKKQIIQVDRFIGAIFLANKKRFINLGCFDENYFFYWEDIDLSSRITLSKYKIFKNQSVKVIHISGSSTSTSLKTFYIRNVNFKFGEYLFQFKNNDLKIIKIIREPLTFILKFIFFTFLLSKKKALSNLFNFLGLVKFYLFYFRFKIKGRL